MQKNIATLLALGQVLQQLCVKPLDFTPLTTRMFNVDSNYYVSRDNKFVVSVTQYYTPRAIEFLIDAAAVGYKIFDSIEVYGLLHCQDDSITGLLSRPWARELARVFTNPDVRDFHSMNVPAKVLPESRINSVTFYTKCGFVVSMKEIDTQDEAAPVSDEVLRQLLSGEAFKKGFLDAAVARPDLAEELNRIVLKPSAIELIPGLM
jgi:hypothetical protein